MPTPRDAQARFKNVAPYSINVGNGRMLASGEIADDLDAKSTDVTNAVDAGWLAPLNSTPAEAQSPDKESR